MMILIRALQRRLTFANGVASLALFVALGGTAYAATALPSNSVGTDQIQARAVTGAKLAPASVDSRQLSPGSVDSRQLAANAVTGGKVADGSLGGDDLGPRSITGALLGGGSVDTMQIAPGAVTLNRLSEGVQRRILQPLRGEAGPQGPAGPAGPAAGRFRFSAPADGAPAQTVIDIPAFRMRASCEVGADGTVANIRVTPSEDVTIVEAVSVDQGADIAQGGSQAFNGNLAISLPGGTETTLGGPSAQTGFARAIATLVMAFSDRTVTAQVAIVVDAEAGRCSIDGTAVTAT